MISTIAANTQIDQQSQRVAIDWRSFSVGSQRSVTNQPALVERGSAEPREGLLCSQIAGRIDADGQVILVNQSG